MIVNMEKIFQEDGDLSQYLRMYLKVLSGG